MRDLLLTAPDSQIDQQVKDMISNWSESPSAEEILRVLDHAVRYSLVSGFVVAVLESILQSACESEGLTYESLIARVQWRKE